jgi:hypothetical protein
MPNRYTTDRISPSLAPAVLLVSLDRDEREHVRHFTPMIEDRNGNIEY